MHMTIEIIDKHVDHIIGKIGDITQHFSQGSSPGLPAIEYPKPEQVMPIKGKIAAESPESSFIKKSEI